MDSLKNIKLVASFSLEELAERLAVDISNNRTVFSKETILIMSSGQRKWLQNFLMQKQGVFANIDIVTPDFYFESLLATDKDKKPLFKDILAWKIFPIVKELSGKLNLSEVESRQLDFSLILSDLFWRYQSFLPKMIRAWQKDSLVSFSGKEHESFRIAFEQQKEIWQKLKFSDDDVPALKYLDFIENEQKNYNYNLPNRIFIFAPMVIPKHYWDFIKRLSQNTEIYLYYHSLSSDLWTETISQSKEIKEIKEENSFFNLSDKLEKDIDLYGNELLLSFGKPIKPFLNALIEDGVYSADDLLDNCKKQTPASHFLGALQNDIHFNRVGDNLFSFLKSEKEEDYSKDEIEKKDLEKYNSGDSSFRINIVHNIVREMEVVRDEIIELFLHKENSLSPKNIVVMIPNLKKYEFAIDFAFKNSGIPYSIADKNKIDDSVYFLTFFEILKVAQGDFSLSSIEELLSMPLIKKAVNFTDRDLESFNKILSSINISWGVDSVARSKEFDSLSDDKKVDTSTKKIAYIGSWEFGIDRLLYSLMTDCSEDIIYSLNENKEVAGIPQLPENANKILEGFFKLFDLLKKISQQNLDPGGKTPIEWADFLLENIIDSFFVSDKEIERDEIVLRKALVDLKEYIRDAGLEKLQVGLAAFVTIFTYTLQRLVKTTLFALNGFLEGKVTFCELQPLRNLPVDVIYFAGMNDGEFPRNASKSNLDLTRMMPNGFLGEITDWFRTEREDDCLLFISAILSAKKYLRISYVGQDNYTNKRIPPAIPILILRDYLLARMKIKEDSAIALFERLHYVNPFDQEYFKNDAKLISYSKMDYEICKNFNRSYQKNNLLNLQDWNLVFKDTLKEEKILSLNQIFYCLKNPISFVVKNILNIWKIRENRNYYNIDSEEDLPYKGIEINKEEWFKKYDENEFDLFYKNKQKYNIVAGKFRWDSEDFKCEIPEWKEYPFRFSKIFERKEYFSKVEDVSIGSEICIFEKIEYWYEDKEEKTKHVFVFGKDKEHLFKAYLLAVFIKSIDVKIDSVLAFSDKKETVAEFKLEEINMDLNKILSIFHLVLEKLILVDLSRSFNLNKYAFNLKMIDSNTVDSPFVKEKSFDLGSAMEIYQEIICDINKSFKKKEFKRNSKNITI